MDASFEIESLQQEKGSILLNSIQVLSWIYFSDRETLHQLKLKYTSNIFLFLSFCLNRNLQFEDLRNLAEHFFFWREIGILRKENTSNPKNGANWEKNFKKCYLRAARRDFGSVTCCEAISRKSSCTNSACYLSLSVIFSSVSLSYYLPSIILYDFWEFFPNENKRLRRKSRNPEG